MNRIWLTVGILCGLLASGVGGAHAQAVHKAPTLSVSPAEGLVSSGSEGGPFTPASRQYSVSNSSDGTLTWSATANQNWVTVTAAPVGQGTQLVVGSASATSGTVDIPLSLLRGTGTDPTRGPSSITAAVVYDPAVLDFQSSADAPLLDTWYGKGLQVSETTSGRLRLVVFGSQNDPTNHPREITTFDNERSDGDPQARQNPFPLGTLRFAVVGASGTSTTVAVEDLSMVDGSIPNPQYLTNVSARNGTFSVSSTPPTMTDSGTVTVAINGNANSLQGSAAGTTHTATVTFSSNGGTATRTVTLTVVESCSAPPAPTGVQASDGGFADRIRVTWIGSVSATQYQVYRSEGTDPASAQALSQWISTASYDDISAEGPTAGSGCGSTPTNRYYRYWVKARNDCGTSGFSASDEGHRGSGRKAALRENVWEEVLPGGGSAQPDAKLFVRLRSDDSIAAKSVWGTIESMAQGTAASWIPAGVDGRDGWVAFIPEGVWMPGDVVTLRAGARTVSGAEVGPVVRQIRIEAAGMESREVPAWQPAAGVDFDATGLSSSAAGEASVMALTDDGAVPPFAEGRGPAYRVGPSGVFDSPQRVWLPVPEGEDPGRLVVYYYHSDGSGADWYPAERVEDWLVPSSELRLDLDQGSYLGFEIAYGAVVRLGVAQVETPTSASVLSVGAGPGNVAGDALVFVVVALVLAGAGRKTMSAKALLCKIL